MENRRDLRVLRRREKEGNNARSTKVETSVRDEQYIDQEDKFYRDASWKGRTKIIEELENEKRKLKTLKKNVWKIAEFFN